MPEGKHSSSIITSVPWFYNSRYKKNLISLMGDSSVIITNVTD